ncbi:MAG: TetR/AcrR family transcriptional regulator [Bacteroidetes bacterium]|nr:TetR/AcrR family transcriptional regulator [Bacteroidota bacterium]
MKQDTNNAADLVILEAAENLFLEKGFALTSTTEIAKVAGCNQALVHYYFRTKERLFDAVFEKYAGLFISTLVQKTEDDISFEEKVRRKADTLFDLLKTNPRIPFLFFNELNTNPGRLSLLEEKIAGVSAAFMLQMESEIQVEIEKGAIRPMTATDLMFTILSLNLLLFLSAPVLKVMLGMSDTAFQHLIENRKRENITVILKSLRP